LTCIRPYGMLLVRTTTSRMSAGVLRNGQNFSIKRIMCKDIICFV
jgi:hypothetical protein